jgi:hypothetical protein
MTTYKFICESENNSWSKVPSSRVEYTVEAVTISDMLEAFEFFLRGCGFNAEGTLDFVEDSLYDDTGA